MSKIHLYLLVALLLVVSCECKDMHVLSTLHLDMQAVAQQLGEKYEQKGMQQEKLHIAKNMLSMLNVETVAQALQGSVRKN